MASVHSMFGKGRGHGVGCCQGLHRLKEHRKTVYTFSSLPVLYALYCVLPLLLHLLFSSPAFYSRHISLAVFILMQLYCLYCTDEGHGIVAETFDPNLRTIWLLFGWCESRKKLIIFILCTVKINNASLLASIGTSVYGHNLNIIGTLW